MTTFLAVCLRQLWSTCDAGQRTTELELRTVLAIQVSNWSLDMEQCPFELDAEQATRLHRTGVQNLNKCFTVSQFYVFIWLPLEPYFVLIT